MATTGEYLNCDQYDSDTCSYTYERDTSANLSKRRVIYFKNGTDNTGLLHFEIQGDTICDVLYPQPIRILDVIRSLDSSQIKDSAFIEVYANNGNFDYRISQVNVEASLHYKYSNFWDSSNENDNKCTINDFLSFLYGEGEQAIDLEQRELPFGVYTFEGEHSALLNENRVVYCKIKNTTLQKTEWAKIWEDTFIEVHGLVHFTKIADDTKITKISISEVWQYMSRENKELAVLQNSVVQLHFNPSISSGPVCTISKEIENTYKIYKYKSDGNILRLNEKKLFDQILKVRESDPVVDVII